MECVIVHAFGTFAGVSAAKLKFILRTANDGILSKVIKMNYGIDLVSSQCKCILPLHLSFACGSSSDTYFPT